MKSRILSLIFLLSLVVSACAEKTEEKTPENQEKPGQEIVKYDPALDTLKYPEEKHFRNVRQLTFGGNNAEAYFSFDNQHLVFQSDYAEWGAECDQIFVMPVVSGAPEKPQQISNGDGRTTCSYFMAGNQEIVYASTHLAGAECPPVPPRAVDGHYVWPVYDSYDIFVADTKGNILRQLTREPGYDAEATLSPDGKTILFTSTRSGDLELWTMDTEGGNLKQLTSDLGYDGGAFFSPDGSKIVWRASRPKTPEEVETYTSLLAKGLVQPTDLEVFVANADGSDVQQVTNLGRANWAPNWHPSGEKIIFASNHKGESGRNFNLFLINVDGTGLEQLTYDTVFDAFPMFSYDGKQVVFSSNRFNGGGHDTNVFVAEWVD